MNRRDLLKSTPVLLLVPLANCALFGPQGDQALQAIFQQVIAAQLAAGVLFNAGQALVAVGVLKLGSTAHDDVNVAFQTVAGALDSVNVDIQTGMATPVQALLNAALAALTAAQQALAKAKPTAAQGNRMVAQNRAMKAIDIGAIIQLVVALLPTIISVGGNVAQLIRNLIASLSAPKNGVVLTIANVQDANNVMHQGLTAWSTAQPA